MEQGFPEAPKTNRKGFMVNVTAIIAWLKKLFSKEPGKWGWR